MNAILYDKIHIAKAVNAQVISLADAPTRQQAMLICFGTGLETNGHCDERC